MRVQYLLLVVVSTLLVLSAAGCRADTTSLGQVAVATAVDRDNAPVNALATIVASAPAIYVAAEVVNATAATRVVVEWRYVTGDRVVATESFAGNRSSDRPQEFVTQVQPTTSYLYSRLSLTDVSWPVGSYEATVALNGSVTKTVGFNVVNESEFDELAKKAMVKNIYLGSAVNTQGQITVPGSTFTRGQPNIYAAVLLQDVPAGTQLRARWRYLPTNQVITDFSTAFSGGGYLPFGIGLNRFSRLWADGLWPAGTYEVTIYVDNILVATKNFSVI